MSMQNKLEGKFTVSLGETQDVFILTAYTYKLTIRISCAERTRRPHSLMVKQLPFKQLTMVRFHVGAQKFPATRAVAEIFCHSLRGIEREGGRGNGSFPVAEILKPLGFRS